ncbi:hypothetical protein [Caulobacter sp. S45]|uniref:hypothetical protein n=1 Tax=Caulobacter sp. S45 TaxID=1641861 RepID=UPI00131BBF0B|nr:hypothetical protein [Caulobacter sp. S45]
MAKAHFHRHQKVWVESVGSWAAIERIIPIWAKGFDEPVRITYDVGLGREFRADELAADTSAEPASAESEGAGWRVLRARNKWQAPEDCGHHPLPGTFPVVVTNDADWGGWRVPGAEYDRDPYKIEQQARMLASAPKLMRLAQDLADWASEAAEDLPPEVLRLARQASGLVNFVNDERVAPEGQPQMQATG